MSWILKGVFAKSPLILGPVTALVLFTGVFVIAVIVALRMRKGRTDALAQLPLCDDLSESRTSREVSHV